MPRCSKRSRSGGAGAGGQQGAGGAVPGATALDEHAHHAHKRSRHGSSRRHSKSEEMTFSVKKCLSWFKEYTDPSEPDVLGPEGMERFCADIEVAPEDAVMLAIAYTMQAKRCGYFTMDEWLKGLTALQCDSAVRLREKLPALRAMLDDPNTFKQIYRYSYDFAREAGQRSLDVCSARALLGVLLPRWSLRGALSQWLAAVATYKVVNRDQWCNILEFARITPDVSTRASASDTSADPDLAAYDADGAWPVMLDEFVEWLRAPTAHRS